LFSDIKNINKEKANPETAQKMHNYVKIPNRVIPVELQSQRIHYKNKKHQQYQMF